MRQATCTLPEGGSIAVSGAGYTRTIVGGDVVDLDQVLAPARPASEDAPARPVFTLADALGHHVDEAFELEAAPRRGKPRSSASAAPASEE